jgi:surface protein
MQCVSPNNKKVQFWCCPIKNTAGALFGDTYFKNFTFGWVLPPSFDHPGLSGIIQGGGLSIPASNGRVTRPSIYPNTPTAQQHYRTMPPSQHSTLPGTPDGWKMIPAAPTGTSTIPKANHKVCTTPANPSNLVNNPGKNAPTDQLSALLEAPANVVQRPAATAAEASVSRSAATRVSPRVVAQSETRTTKSMKNESTVCLAGTTATDNNSTSIERHVPITGVVQYRRHSDTDVGAGAGAVAHVAKVPGRVSMRGEFHDGLADATAKNHPSPVATDNSTSIEIPITDVVQYQRRSATATDAGKEPLAGAALGKSRRKNTAFLTMHGVLGFITCIAFFCMMGCCMKVIKHVPGTEVTAGPLVVPTRTNTSTNTKLVCETNAFTMEAVAASGCTTDFRTLVDDSIIGIAGKSLNDGVKDKGIVITPNTKVCANENAYRTVLTAVGNIITASFLYPIVCILTTIGRAAVVAQKRPKKRKVTLMVRMKSDWKRWVLLLCLPLNVVGYDPVPNGDGSYKNTGLRRVVSDWIAGGTLKDAVVAKYGEIENWSTSEVTNLKYVFYGKSSFNADISKWVVSSVTTMYRSRSFLTRC